MAHPMADALHPAFSNLFVQYRDPCRSSSHFLYEASKVKRRGATMDVSYDEGSQQGEQSISYETDRYKFIGRGRSQVHPAVMDSSKPLSGSQGPVLDPIVAIQYRITVDEGETAIVDFITGVAPTREDSQYLIDKYQDRHMRDRAFELSMDA
jgi:hypothetical protein